MCSRHVINSHNILPARLRRSGSGGACGQTFRSKGTEWSHPLVYCQFPVMCSKWMVNSKSSTRAKMEQNRRCGEQGQRGRPISTRLRGAWRLLLGVRPRMRRSAFKAAPGPRTRPALLSQAVRSAGRDFPGWLSGEPRLTPGILTNLKRAIGRDPSCRGLW